MPQETNLNVTPYFDDFLSNGGAKDNNYYKVLFKPGYPVQARELTTLQSILQNQIEQFGNHTFKEGSVVIPGNVHYISDFPEVEVESEFLGIPISFYGEELIGKIITGEDSKVKAKVVTVRDVNNSPRKYFTLYLQYIDAGANNGTKFANGENLLLVDGLVKGSLVIQPNQPFAITASKNAAGKGSAVSVAEGVYYARGTFVSVDEQLIILEPYSNKPNYKVGFDVIEEIITVDEDSNLADNAKGFNNYAAPGADRFKISLILSKKSLEEDKHENFIQLLEIRNGLVFGTPANFNRSMYNILADDLARRTYDESGHYYIKPFALTVKNSLNDLNGNNGIYREGNLTSQNNKASDNLGVYQLSPGKAYVRGYEAETISNSLIDFKKPRTTKTIPNQSINYLTGPTLRVNNSSGAPQVGLATSYIVSLRNSRVNSDPFYAAGKEIGLARVYDYTLKSGGYDNTYPDSNQWDISLYDIQPYTELFLNQNTTLTVPTHIRGAASGAEGFLRFAISNSGIVTAYSTKGTFIPGEQLYINGLETSGITTSVNIYSLTDVKSLYGNSGTGISSYSADVVQVKKVDFGQVSITSSTGSGGVCTVTSASFTFPNVVSVNDVVSFSIPGNTVPTYAKVSAVYRNDLVITPTTSVAGVCNGSLPTSAVTPSDFALVTAKLSGSTDNTLFTPLPKQYISSVNLEDSNLTIRKQFDVSITNGSTNVITAGPNETFLSFDQERYILTRSNGTIEALSDDRIENSVFVTSGGNQLQITGLSTTASDANAKLIATLRKINVKSKNKLKKKVNSIIIDKSSLPHSGIGQSTLNDGLTYGNYPYGTRVQDDEICLLYPDVTRLYGVFESSATDNPSDSPVITRIRLSKLNGPTNQTGDLITGERFVGKKSECIGLNVGRYDDESIEYLSINKKSPSVGETVKFSDSGITGVIEEIIVGDPDITSHFIFDSGQSATIYDYAKISRTSSASQPTRKIRIIFENAYYDSTDDGDITTVSSYQQYSYPEIPFINTNLKSSDVIDIRPRVSDAAVSAGSRSPFEFLGRTFNSSSNSAKNILASNESFLLSYSIYLGRVDSIYFSKEGTFNVIQGAPAETPKPPAVVNESFQVATVKLAPYLIQPSDAVISLIKHKRYRMEDIAGLETRISNLEYYTTLSLLETKTENTFIPDSKGLNRFKSGFFVDNFSSLNAQARTSTPKNSIDSKNSELRPSHFTTQIDLILGSKSIIGIGTTVVANVDSRYVEDIIGTNIKKTDKLVTLDYNNVLYFKQPFATRSINVTPYLVTDYNGSIELNPSSDIWIDTTRLEPQTITIDTYTPFVDEIRAQAGGFDTQTGWAPVQWGSWQTNWLGVDVSADINLSSSSSTSWNGWGWGWPWWGWGGSTTTTTTTSASISVGVGVQEQQSRTGTQMQILPNTTTTSLGDRVVDSSVITHLRSRNIEFTAKKFKPFAQVYAFFDGVDINKFVMPKLVEIRMISGTFTVGETVEGIDPSVVGNAQSEIPEIIFRVAKSNHKYGPYNSPTDIFDSNPYDPQNTIPSNYTSTSTIINVDTYQLASSTTDIFAGYVSTGMRLKGRTSKALAVVTNVRLITDDVGTLIGSFYVPNPNISTNPRFSTGNRTFRLTNSKTNATTAGLVETSGEETFFSQGTLNTMQQTNQSTRSPRFNQQTTTQNRVIGSSDVATDTATTTTSATTRNGWGWGWWWGRDPLAQSFYIGEPTGAFITKVDLFFRTVDPTKKLPVIVQLRSMANGYPTQEVYPFSEVSVDAKNIKVSSDGSVATTVTFPSPVFLAGQKEHALVILSDSTDYNVWICRMGEVDITTASGPESRQVVVTKQPSAGSLFKSQNGSTWDASQYDDLKYTMYRADFKSSQPGNVNFFNPKLTKSNKQIARLQNNPITFYSKKIRVSLASSLNDSELVLGNTVLQSGSNATGNLVGFAGSATGTMRITNQGIGYYPNDGSSATYSNVSLTTLSGYGYNATANITIGSTTTGDGTVLNGVAIAATIVNGGNGYNIGDVLSVSSLGGQSSGRNLRFTVAGIGATNVLVLDQVQGDFITGTGSTIQYTNSSGITTNLNASTGIAVTTTSIRSQNKFEEGLYIKVNHKNHGMHSKANQVQISGVLSNKNPSKLTTNISATTTTIPLDNAAIFTSFEGVSVGSTNRGYALIESEIISYTGVSNNSLTGVTRSIDGTGAFAYDTNTLIYKYENSGISLKRINKTHVLDNVPNWSYPEPIGFDHYWIKLDMSGQNIGQTNQITERSTSSSFPKLYINETKSSGGSKVYASQNIQYEILHPTIQTLNFASTKITAKARTISGTSVDSSTEISFLDKGFENITLNQDNYLSDPRIICSEINTNKLDNVTGNKSLEISLDLESSNTFVSPVIDLDRVGAVLISNRINNVITNWVSDNRTGSINGDPTAFIYATSPIALELPATSLKLLLTAYVNSDAELRAMYAIGNSEAEAQIYNLFPGYDNLDTNGTIINKGKCSGLSNKKVQKSVEFNADSSKLSFREYEFSIDNLPAFKYYSIKLAGTSTNQAHPPRVKNLRVIALA
jgi:hypothetical protein